MSPIISVSPTTTPILPKIKAAKRILEIVNLNSKPKASQPQLLSNLQLERRSVDLPKIRQKRPLLLKERLLLLARRRDKELQEENQKRKRLLKRKLQQKCKIRHPNLSSSNNSRCILLTMEGTICLREVDPLPKVEILSYPNSSRMSCLWFRPNLLGLWLPKITTNCTLFTSNPKILKDKDNNSILNSSSSSNLFPHKGWCNNSMVALEDLKANNNSINRALNHSINLFNRHLAEILCNKDKILHSNNKIDNNNIRLWYNSSSRD